MEMAVNKLADATDFCQKIVLGETFREEGTQLYICKFIYLTVPC